MDLAAALRAFLRIVERGSMTAAAADLGVSQPAVSKLLRNLEAHVGARLLERGPRALRPTARGLALYEAAGGPLAAIDAALENLRGEGAEIAGELRLHGPSCIGEVHLRRIVTAFQDAHPHVCVSLSLENRPVDLIFENIDVALRMGRPSERSLIQKRIGFSRRILVASPSYLSRSAPLRDVADLSAHDLLVTDASLRNGALRLRKRETAEDIPARPKLVTNSAQVLVSALREGRGIATAQLLLVAEELRSGALVRVLPDHEIEPSEFFLVYPSARFLRPVVRAFVDFAAPALRRVEGIF
ncbi:LysR family transcriptional regulator [Methylosinus sporium]|uniref:LysR family transcriptional regulator n=1 Tax=Methylosinus sporium TaxID=428 RepID=A0A549T4C8_METSR|nr:MULTISPECIES: LysR family transcriptional regulator [Methylosinus]MBU3889243.1 LysR family transcriptional regulator [Methylosinus sp. KRF6]TRL36630.1 LysR family transcriptional regulator [Methylosinus sporium]